MAGEYWRQIEVERVRLEEENRRRDQMERSQRERDEKERRIMAEKRLTEEKDREKEKRRIVEDTVKKLKTIFEDIKSNSPALRKEPLKTLVREADTLILKWGSKFELTASERRFIEDNQIAKLSVFRSIPEEIVEHDFYSMSGSVTDSSIVLSQHYRDAHFNTGEFLENPRIILPSIASFLADPLKYRNVASKGSSYWMSQETLRSRNRYTGDEGNCCCT